MCEIIIDRNAKQITFTNNGIGFSQFGIANEILDLIENKINEIERLNNIIKRFEDDLREMYLTFGEFSEEYTEKRIQELKESDKNVRS